MTQISPLPLYTPIELRQQVHSSVCNVDLDFPDAAPRGGTTFGGLRLGPVDVFQARGEGVLRGYRTPFHIRADHVDDFLISMPRAARITLSQSSRSVCLEPGTFAFYSTRQPGSFEIVPGSASDPFELTHVRISGALLRQQIPYIDACCMRAIEVHPGAGRIMQSMIDTIFKEGWALRDEQSGPLSQLLVDAVANFIRSAPELIGLNTATRNAFDKVRETAKTFIATHLTDPDLDLSDIARHCGVSVRYLHKAFAACAHSVSDHIRDSRLLQCRTALQAPALASRTVTEIAMMWGFNDSTSFGRAYKAKFGIVPSKDRCATALPH